ncbi:MAG: hypothetical protein ACI9IT_000539 [Glaciecola sp.]|jgi:hypothetical protein
MGLKEPLLCDDSEGGVPDENDHEVYVYTKTGTQKNEVHYQLSSRSRCTQLCIFLILESRQGNVIGAEDSQNARNHEHMVAHTTTTSTILFKWQTTESHYRALASAMTQNKKRIA